MLKVKLMFDRILIEVPEETKTSSGLIIADNKEAQAYRKGKIVAAGPGLMTGEGKIIPLTVKANDEVLFNFGETVTIDGKNYIMAKEGDVALIF